MRIVLLVLTLFATSMSFAQGKAKARYALAGTDGAAVYKDADFDSEVVTYLKTGERVIATHQSYPGKGGIGLFFRIKTNQGVMGYVTDIDLVSEGTKRSISPLLRNKEKKRPKQKTYEDEMKEEEPIYFTRFIGGTLGKKVHKIKYEGTTYSSDLMFFGFRGSGPGTLFDGPPIDFNLLLSFQSPDYYKNFADNDPNGFIVFTDLLLQLPFWENKNHMFSYALGFMGLYSSYAVKVGGKTADTKEFRLGGELGVGYSYLFQKFLFRFDYRYQFERFQTSSYMFSLQKEY